jgi:hypothetical protein
MIEELDMPRQSKYIQAQVQKLIDRADMYGRNAQSYRRKASGKFRRVSRKDLMSPGQTDPDFAYMNPDLDNWDWDTDGKMQAGMDLSQTLRKDYACLNDAAADDSLDSMLATIGKMRAAGATKSDMDRAWAIFHAAQS